MAPVSFDPMAHVYDTNERENNIFSSKPVGGFFEEKMLFSGELPPQAGIQRN